MLRFDGAARCALFLADAAMGKHSIAACQLLHDRAQQSVGSGHEIPKVALHQGGCRVGDLQMPMSGRLILKCDVVYSRCLCDESAASGCSSRPASVPPLRARPLSGVTEHMCTREVV